MIKRITAISFILIANIILLAHAVIPHGHHHGEVCIVNHCQNDIDPHKHNDTEHDHKHKGNPDYQFCILKQLVVVPQKSIYSSCNCLDDQYHSHYIQAVLFDSNVIIARLGGISKLSQNYTSFCHSLFVAAGVGLRAPPVV